MRINMWTKVSLSLCTDAPLPSEKIWSLSPFFSEGSGASVHRLNHEGTFSDLPPLTSALNFPFPPTVIVSGTLFNIWGYKRAPFL